MDRRDELLKMFSAGIRNALRRAEPDWEKLQEIRLRVDRPLLVVSGGREYQVTDSGLRPTGGGCRERTGGEAAGCGGYRERIGGRTAGGVEGRERIGGRTAGSGEGRERIGGRTAGGEDRGRIAGGAYVVASEELRETLECIGSHSLYAFEDEIRQGFITIQGGHRIGLAGKVVLDEGRIRTIKYISFMNVRLSHQIKGCADRIMPYLYEDGRVLHTLIVSPPGCGKTTLLRDVIRQMSDGGTGRGAESASQGSGRGVTVGVVDERSELAACWQGIPQNDLGIRTDVLDCCPKAKGMMMLIRTMSPDVVAADEIGSREDLEAMEYVMNCGCRLLVTVHGRSVDDVARKPILGRMAEEGMFERYVVLSGRNGPGTVEEIRDAAGNVLYGCGRDVSSNNMTGGGSGCGLELRGARW